MASPEAIFEREAVRSYMVAECGPQVGHHVANPHDDRPGVTTARPDASTHQRMDSGHEPDDATD